MATQFLYPVIYFLVQQMSIFHWCNLCSLSEETPEQYAKVLSKLETGLLEYNHWSFFSFNMIKMKFIL